MGACNFITFAEGTDHHKAYAAAVEEAQYEYGHDPYNGTISTCGLARRQPMVVQKRFTKKAIDRAYDIAEKDDYGRKWEARAIDCGLVPHKKGVHMWAFYGWASC